MDRRAARDISIELSGVCDFSISPGAGVGGPAFQMAMDFEVRSDVLHELPNSSPCTIPQFQKFLGEPELEMNTIELVV